MSDTTTGSPSPRASALAMFPAPISPIRMAGQAYGARWPLRLVEEALLDQTRPLLGGDLDVARREKEDLVGDALHSAVERVGEPRCEVDQALREVRVAALEVEDDRNVVLELVRDLLGVVEARGDDEVDLDAAPPAVLHGDRKSVV